MSKVFYNRSRLLEDCSIFRPFNVPTCWTRKPNRWTCPLRRRCNFGPVITGLTCLLLGVAAGPWTTARAAAAEDSPLPNFVLILADDFGWHQLGCYGSTFYESPNIDRLADQGMRFTSAYAACPVCSPTRASIMTGKYPARLHLTDWIKGETHRDRKLLVPEWTAHLELDELTIAEALRDAGYLSGHFGKWHLNVDKRYKHGRPGDPGSQGFDDVLTTGKPRPDADPTKDAHHVDEITDRAIKFMRKNRERPFFCYVAHNSIHNPLMEHSDRIAKYAAKPNADKGMNLPVLGAMIETLDRSVGRILAALDETKLADRTLVVFVSDNGDLHGRDQLKPLRGGKAEIYEGGIRVPMIVRWPGRVAPGTSCHTPVCTIDLYPTFLAAAGIENRDAAIDGQDISPLLTGKGQFERTALFWHYPHYHRSGSLAPAGTIRAGQYKLIEWFEKSIDGANTPGALQLFDLGADIGEQHDLSKEKHELTAQLYQQLVEWRASVGAQMMTRNPDHEVTSTRSKTERFKEK